MQLKLFFVRSIYKYKQRKNQLKSANFIRIDQIG